ncbi:phage portal protein [Limosilactobacillus reuteri]|uniref:phage portal protein n=1 Tax=Limosilactobacillus reuteri TaxID=1598 RepID=UPI00081BFE9B|nr:phage portal protein [Limosilactobacillus reuteri]MCH5379837.1 phage portal protein [Limosilactobacillus reuteri]OCW63663.1 phage portal protein [Limosilactobacillus reuteri]OCW65685.1 phage portal protein [Limosilactobacillus reuteri]OCW66042.1 phage portal protein [Limosilactobacillus reuteri]OCW68871.1 phage portal protein [Limosilactobacillus reuteri]
MPLFNQKVSPGLSINDDTDILHFLNPDGDDKYIDARTALKNSDIYSIVFQLSADLANGKLRANMPRAQGILNNPTQTSNAHAFWQSMYAQLLLGGEAFAYRWRNQNGTDMTWEYLRPSQVTPFLLEDGSGLIYNVNFDEPEVGVMEAVPQSDLIHIRLLSQNGGKTGISPLSALGNELKIKDQSNKLTLSALARSIVAPGILSIEHGGLLSDEQKASRSRKFMKQTASSNNGPIVLDDLETYTPLEVKSNVAQLLNQVTWTSAQIAKVYGVSDSIINGQGDQQSSIQMMGNAYVKSLSRYAKAITGELNNKLSAEVTLDLRSAIDPLGDEYASTVANLQKNGTLGANQASWLLQQVGYLPEDLPEKEQPKIQVQPVQMVSSKDKQPAEGGEDNDQDQS